VINDASEEAPAFRASVLQPFLAAVRGMDEGAAILAQCDPADVELVETSFRADWIPVERGLCFYRAAHAVGGLDLVVRVARANVATQGKLHVMFQPLVRGAVNVFGGGPVTIFRQLPRALSLSNRNTGRVQLRSDVTDRIVYDWTELPDAMRDEIWVAGQRGVSVGMLDLLGYHGTCDYDISRLDAGEVSFEVAVES